MEKMVETIMSVLNRKLAVCERIRKDGNERIADDVFKEFLGQAELVYELTGKRVELKEDENGLKAVLV